MQSLEIVGSIVMGGIGKLWTKKNRTKKPLKSTSFHCLETHLQ